MTTSPPAVGKREIRGAIGEISKKYDRVEEGPAGHDIDGRKAVAVDHRLGVRYAAQVLKNQLVAGQKPAIPGMLGGGVDLRDYSTRIPAGHHEIDGLAVADADSQSEGDKGIAVDVDLAAAGDCQVRIAIEEIGLRRAAAGRADDIDRAVVLQDLVARLLERGVSLENPVRGERGSSQGVGIVDKNLALVDQRQGAGFRAREIVIHYPGAAAAPRRLEQRGRHCHDAGVGEADCTPLRIIEERQVGYGAAGRRNSQTPAIAREGAVPYGGNVLESKGDAGADEIEVGGKHPCIGGYAGRRQRRFRRVAARAGRQNPGTAPGGGTDESRRSGDVGARFPGQALQEGGAPPRRHRSDSSRVTDGRRDPAPRRWR